MFTPPLRDMETLLIHASLSRSRQNFYVLVSGVGLGRLTYNVAKLGRISQSGTSISITDSFVRFLLPRK
jgi:hypothetical protein